MPIDWTSQIISDPLVYAVAVPAVILLGLSKGGFPGIAAISTPMLALVMPPVQAAAIMLPILVVMDFIALYAYRRTFDMATLRVLLPASMLGVGFGWLIAAHIDADAVRLIVGTVAIAFAVDHWLGLRPRATTGQSVGKGLIWGALSGFTSFVAHAGAPPYQVYTMPLGLAPRVFAGTSVVFFAAVNVVKLVPYFFLGQFNNENLATSAVLLPLAPVATLAGVWLVKRVSETLFYRIMYIALFVLGVKLVWDGAVAFAASLI